MKINAQRVGHMVSRALMIKAMAGCAFATLALFGVATPHLGLEPSLWGDGAAASVGAVIGLAVALKG